MQHRTVPTFVAAFAVGLSLALAPSTATAQLGKLKKAAADAVKDKAGVKTDDASANKSSEDFAITAERLDAVMIVFEETAKAYESEAAARSVKADYDKRRIAFETCATTGLQGGMVTPTNDGIQRSTIYTTLVSTMAGRAQTTLTAKKYREYLQIVDSTQVMSSMSAVTMFGLDAKCKPAFKPAAILDEEAARMARANSGSSDNGASVIEVKTSTRAGLSNRQFGMVRERAALWALQQSGNAPVGNSKYQVFTAAEQAVLEAKAARLKAMAPFLKASPHHWLTWSDLSTW